MLKKVGIKISLSKARQHFISEKNLKLDSIFRINFATLKIWVMCADLRRIFFRPCLLFLIANCTFRIIDLLKKSVVKPVTHKD